MFYSYFYSKSLSALKSILVLCQIQLDYSWVTALYKWPHTHKHTHMAIYILYSHSHTNQMQRVRKIQFTLTQTHPVQVLGVTAFKTGYIILLPLTM